MNRLKVLATKVYSMAKSNVPRDGGNRNEEAGSRNDERLPLDAVLKLLARRPRRLILHYLAAEDDAAFEDLITFVIDHDVDVETDDHDRLLIALYHLHLPKLAAADLIDYDTRDETVRYRGAPKVDRLLAVTADWDF